MIGKMKKSLIKSVIIAIFIGFFLPAEAANLSIRPFLIDESVEARDIVTHDVTLTNESGNKMNVYAAVNEISVDNDGDIKEFVSPVMTDRTTTVTSWIEITRGRITLEPFETKTVPLTFRINPQALPGEYHAFVSFYPTQKAHLAEQAALAGNADGVIVKLTIEDKSEEFLRVSSFIINRFVISKEHRDVKIEVENLGDTAEVPTGEIAFYNSLGEEVTTVKLNESSVEIPPGEKKLISATIPFYNELGRYKANLTMQYGTKQRANIYDSTQFFMMPFHIMILIVFAIVVLSLLIAWLMHRSFKEREIEEDSVELPLYVRDGHEPNPKDHDIDLSAKN